MEEKKDLGDLLRRREELDGALSEFKKPMAVIFADIKGSTDYFDRWGDLEGKLMVQRCENIMLPIFEEKGAKFKRLGDGVMAYFENTETAVMAAMAVQKGIHQFNEGKEERLQLHVRIGINAGLAFIEEDDISGDVVNVASRVESLAPVDGICISRSVYEQVRHSDEIICRYMGEREVKGKAEPIRVYQVKWAEEEMTVGALRGAEAPAREPSGEEKGKVFHLEVFSEGEKVRVKSHEGESGEERTLKFYEDAKISLRRIEEYATKIKSLLDKANKSGKIGGEILAALKQNGQLLFEELLPPRTRERLNTTNVRTLVLNLDEGLVHIPWELIYDGKEFLCQRFSMGRVVSTKQEFSAGNREIGLPLRMLLLADPQGNLPSSYDEGVKVRDMLERAGDMINVSLKTSDVGTEYTRAKLRYFDIVHYAGHAEYDASDPAKSGFLLSDGRLDADDIRNMVGRMPFPSLVVSNACRSGETGEWKMGAGYEKVFGMANAFLLSGVRHYLGTFWDVQDEPSKSFSLDFYAALLNGVSIGEAVRQARQGLIDRYGEDTIVWASYLLYGDPTFRYVREGVRQAEAAGTTAQTARAVPAGALRSDEADTVVFPRQQRALPLAGIAVAALLAIAALIFVIQRRPSEQASAPSGSIPIQVVAPTLSPDQEEARAERIDALVEDLARKYREGGDAVPAAPADPWTSTPVSVVFLGVKAQGISDMEKDFLMARLVEDIQETGRLKVVERELLDKLLAELKLSASDLADATKALKLGRILSARLIGTGGIVRDGNTWMVNLRIIETETSAIKSAITAMEETDDRARVAAGLAASVLERVGRWYPLQGKVLSVQGKGATINIGANVGLAAGTRLALLNDGLKPVGEVETTRVLEETSETRLVAGKTGIDEGMRVRMEER